LGLKTPHYRTFLFRADFTQKKRADFKQIYPDLNGFEGWMDKKNDFQWIRRQLFSKPLCVDYKSV
jgi:hypothetical protein